MLSMPFVDRIVEGREGIVAAHRGQRVARRAPASTGQHVDQSLRSDAHVLRRARIVDADVVALAFGPLVRRGGAAPSMSPITRGT